MPLKYWKVFKLVNFSLKQSAAMFYCGFRLLHACFLYFECRKDATLMLVTGMALPVPLGLNHGKIALR